MDERHKRLMIAWERFLQSGDETGLVDLVTECSAPRLDCGHRYPYLHRIVDLRLGGQPLSLLRCCACDEVLGLEPIEPEYWSPEPGVPYALQGERLRFWVEQEDQYPGEDKTEWGPYLDGTAASRKPSPEAERLIEEIFGPIVREPDRKGCSP